MATQTSELDSASFSDDQLAQRAGAGDTDAFEALYRRHAEAAWRMAQVVTGNPHDAADAVSEAFTRLLRSMSEGKVRPGVPFRPYLLVATRNAAIDILRGRQRVEPADLDLTDLVTPGSLGPSDFVMVGMDTALVATAFRSLPERWRSVLWLTEVEGIPAREVGERLGMSANAAAQLAVRARNGLRERFLQAHLRDTPNPACQDAISQLGAYAAGALAPRGVAKVDQHLAGCGACRARLAELEDVESGLRRILLPLPLLLGPVVVARFVSSAAGGQVIPTAHGSAAWLLGGPRTARLAAGLTRPLATATAGLLALGVISAAVVGDNAGLAPVAAGNPGKLAPNGAPSIAIIAPTASISAPPVATGPEATSPIPITTSTPAGAVPGVAPVTNDATPPPNKRTVAPPVNPPSGKPTLQLAAGANLGAITVSGAAGLGNGACTGLSVSGTSSCAPAAPTKPGVTASALSPLSPSPISV